MFVVLLCVTPIFFFFFFNDTATTEIYTLSLHDALPIFELSIVEPGPIQALLRGFLVARRRPLLAAIMAVESEAQLAVVHGNLRDILDLPAGGADELSLDVFGPGPRHFEPPGVGPAVPLHRDVPSAV